MEYTIRKVQYYNTSVKDQPGEAYRLLTLLADIGVNLLAFTAVPVGPMQTQLALFPEDPLKLESEARKARLLLEGPHRAIIVAGDDRLGALTDIHLKLFRANVNVYASSGVSDGKGCYGYVIYVRSDDFERAAAALEA